MAKESGIAGACQRKPEAELEAACHTASAGRGSRCGGALRPGQPPPDGFYSQFLTSLAYDLRGKNPRGVKETSCRAIFRVCLKAAFA